MPKLFWLFDYDTLIALCPLAGALWAFGGGGWLALRHILLPAVLGQAAWAMGMPLWALIISTVGLAAASTLPYGDDIHDKMNKKGLGWAYAPFVFVVGSMYGISVLPLLAAKSHWVMACFLPVMTGWSFGCLMIVSKSSGLEWKICEVFVGMEIGAAWAWAVWPR